jgi:hypothetical protein
MTAAIEGLPLCPTIAPLTLINNIFKEDKEEGGDIEEEMEDEDENEIEDEDDDHDEQDEDEDEDETETESDDDSIDGPVSPLSLPSPLSEISSPSSLASPLYIPKRIQWADALEVNRFFYKSEPALSARRDAFQQAAPICMFSKEYLDFVEDLIVSCYTLDEEVPFDNDNNLVTVGAENIDGFQNRELHHGFQYRQFLTAGN